MTYARRKTRITYEGISFLSILAFIILGSIMRQINLLVLLSGLMIAPFFFNWRISRKMLERVRFKRDLPELAHAASPFAVEWSVANDRRHIASWEIKISDAVAAPGASRKDRELVEIIVPQVAPGQTVSTSYRCLLAGRGIYEFGPAIASAAFPLGLVRSSSAIRKTQLLTVAPRLGQLTTRWKKLTQSSAVGMRSTSRRKGLSNDEFYAIRPWRPGDARRIVHWRSTAKHGELMVKQFDERTDHDFGVVLDLFATDTTAQETVEMAVSFMATVVSQMHQQIKGDALVGIFGDDSWYIKERMSRFLQIEVLKRLATVQPAQTGNLVPRLRQINRETDADTGVIVLSTREAPPLSEMTELISSRNTLTWIDVSSAEGRSYFQLNESANVERDFIASGMTK